MNKKDWDGSYYKEHSNPQYQSALKILEKVNFKGNERILDVGCGNGKTTAEIAKKVPEGAVIGIDNSPSMIEQGQKDWNTIKNLTFACIDAMEIPFKNQFDYVFSFSTFHWITDQQKAFNNIYHALKKGGSMIIKCGCDADCPMRRAFIYVCNSPKWKNYFEQIPQKYNGKTVDDYQKMIKNAGFYNAKVDLFYQIRPIEFNSFVKWLMGVLPFDTGLTPEKAQELAREITEHIFKQKNRSLNETIEYENPAVLIEAIKT